MTDTPVSEPIDPLVPQQFDNSDPPVPSDPPPTQG